MPDFSHIISSCQPQGTVTQSRTGKCKGLDHQPKGHHEPSKGLLCATRLSNWKKLHQNNIEGGTHKYCFLGSLKKATFTDLPLLSTEKEANSFKSSSFQTLGKNQELVNTKHHQALCRGWGGWWAVSFFESGAWFELHQGHCIWGSFPSPWLYFASQTQPFFYENPV